MSHGRADLQSGGGLCKHFQVDGAHDECIGVTTQRVLKKSRKFGVSERNETPAMYSWKVLPSATRPWLTIPQKSRLKRLRKLDEKDDGDGRRRRMRKLCGQKRQLCAEKAQVLERQEFYQNLSGEHRVRKITRSVRVEGREKGNCFSESWWMHLVRVKRDRLMLFPSCRRTPQVRACEAFSLPLQHTLREC